MVPAYPCPVADAVRDAFQTVPAWTTHLKTNASLKARLDEVFGTAGLDALAARTCHGHPLPCNSAGTCVSEADAASVFAIGDFEYECVAIPSVCQCCVDRWAKICSYIWHAAQNASNYTSLTFGKNMPAPRRLS